MGVTGRHKGKKGGQQGKGVGEDKTGTLCYIIDVDD